MKILKIVCIFSLKAFFIISPIKQGEMEPQAGALAGILISIVPFCFDRKWEKRYIVHCLKLKQNIKVFGTNFPNPTFHGVAEGQVRELESIFRDPYPVLG